MTERERCREIVDKLEPYWPDLLHRGAIQTKCDPSPTPTYVLQFRQVDSGTQDGRQKRIYIGKSKLVADLVMDEIWERREKQGTRLKKWGKLGRNPRATRYYKREKPSPEMLQAADELLDMLRRRNRGDE